MNKRKTLVQKLKSEARKTKEIIKKCDSDYLKKLEIDIGVSERVRKEAEDECEKLKRINKKLSLSIFEMQIKKKFFRRVWEAIRGK